MQKLLRLLLAFGAIHASFSAFAQTITAYHVFGPAAPNASYLYTNLDGATLYSRPIVVSNVLYGTTAGDNSNALGGLYRINADGSGFTNLFAFSFLNSSNVNGSNPFGALAESNGVLYGMTRNGGTNFAGSIYKINTDGTGFAQLYEFSAANKTNYSNLDGAFPAVGLTLANNTLYGTANQGGSNGLGTVFKIGIDGSGFTNLWTFNGTNGARPNAALTLVGNTLYGTTSTGGQGSSTNGSVFAIRTDGSGFTNLHFFSMLGYPSPANADGAYPQGAVTYYNGLLYGLTSRGGPVGNGYGMFYALGTNGDDFSPLYAFDFFHGAAPLSDLFETNGVFYGTTETGGANQAGVVFHVQPNGAGYTDMYDFALPKYTTASGYTNTYGAEPWAGVVMAGTAIVGVTPTGGPGGTGTIYALVNGSTPPPAPTLTAQLSGQNLILTWPTPTYALQSTPALGTPFTTIPTPSTNYTLNPTNPQAFFRLARQ